MERTNSVIALMLLVACGSTEPCSMDDAPCKTYATRSSQQPLENSVITNHINCRADGCSKWFYRKQDLRAHMIAGHPDLKKKKRKPRDPRLRHLPTQPKQKSSPKNDQASNAGVVAKAVSLEKRLEKIKTSKKEEASSALERENAERAKLEQRVKEAALHEDGMGMLGWIEWTKARHKLHPFKDEYEKNCAAVKWDIHMYQSVYKRRGLPPLLPDSQYKAPVMPADEIAQLKECAAAFDIMDIDTEVDDFSIGGTSAAAAAVDGNDLEAFFQMDAEFPF